MLVRAPTGHVCPPLSNSGGAHYCLGSRLARLYLNIALRELFTRLPTLALAIAIDDIPWDEDILFTRPALLPVTW